MGKSKFFEVVELFNKNERNDILIFSNLSFHKLSIQDRDILSYIFDAIHRRRKVDDSIAKEKFLKTNDVSSWNRTKERLLNMLQRYILMEEGNSDTQEGNYLLIKYFYKLGLDKNYRAAMKKGMKSTALLGGVDEKNFHHQFLLHEAKLEELAKNRIEGKALDQMDDALDIYYAENKLRCMVFKVNRKTIYNTALEDSIFLETVDHLCKTIESPGVVIYYNLYKMLTEAQSESYFLKIEQLIKKWLNHFSPSYCEEIINHLMNYCIRKLNIGETDYAEVYIDYIELLYDEELLSMPTVMNLTRYKNIVSMALLTGNTRRAKLILNKFSPYLESQYRVMATNFAAAQVAFQENGYEAAYQYLMQYKSINLSYDLAYKKLFLKVQYHFMLKGEYDLDRYITNIKSIIKHNQSQKTLNTTIKNQIDLFYKTLLCITKGKEANLEKIYGKINQLEYQWLKGIST